MINQTHIIETPEGRYTFVGRVPTALVTDDPEIQNALRLCGMTIARRMAESRGVKLITSYTTRQEALNALWAWEKGQV